MTVGFNVTIPVGFARIEARLDLGPDSGRRLSPARAALVWVADGADGDHDNAGTAATAARLAAASAAVRKFGNAENGASRAVILDNAAADAASRSGSARRRRLGLDPTGTGSPDPALIRALLAPELVSAVEAGSPAALWSVLRGTDHTTRCHGPGAEPSAPACMAGVYTIPVLAPGVGEELIAEIAEAKSTAGTAGRKLSIPNNQDRERTPNDGVVLDEVGLGGLAMALVTRVLAPFAQLLYPQWCPWDFDSYHAFSIHVGALAGTRQVGSATDPASGRVGADLEGPVVHRGVGDRLPLHIDICEASMNLCLGTAGFNGSRVHFAGLAGAVNAGKPGAAVGADSTVEGKVVEHVPGRAFVNLCQHFHGTDALTTGAR